MIKRWNLFGSDMSTNPNGDWCLYSDVAALESQLQAAQVRIEELEIKPAVFCDAHHCQFGKIIQCGDGWNEPYSSDFDCNKLDELSQQGYNDFELDGDDLPICPMFRFDVSDWVYESKQAQAELEALRADNAELISWFNTMYMDCQEWNEGKHDAEELLSDFMGAIKESIITKPHPGTSLLSELEGLRKVAALAEKLLDSVDIENEITWTLLDALSAA